MASAERYVTLRLELRLADALLNLILVECVRMAASAAPSSPCGEAGGSARRISAACSQYISAHFHEPLTLSRVAGAICVSPFYLSHVFSGYMGITFTEYLTDVRMHHARSMLAESDSSIGEIADRVGFSDVYHFSKVYKRHHGIPPGGVPQGAPLRGASPAAPLLPVEVSGAQEGASGSQGFPLQSGRCAA